MTANWCRSIRGPELQIVYPVALSCPVIYDRPMGIAVSIFAWTVAGGAWAAILGLPVALVVPRSRRWLLRPVTRRLKAGRARALEARDRARVMEQARRDARTEKLEADLAQVDSILEKYGI